MIIKSHDLIKIDLDKNNQILFYGQNTGAKEEEISNILKIKKNIKPHKYEEKEIIDNYENFYNEITSQSLFEEEKIFIIKRATDKLEKILQEISEKNLSNILLIINAENLEKKSKLRNLFEKNKKLVCVPFYPDNNSQLARIAINYFNKLNYSMSQSNINLIINKTNGDRGVLVKELEKIEFFIRNNKKITTEQILKLVNIIENHSISELIDNCLAKNKKKIINILNENNFNNEDSIIIVRTFLNKSKKILKLRSEYEKNKDMDLTITSARPPIFWKDKEIVKQQLINWNTKSIKNLIYKLNSIELLVKKNIHNSLFLTTNFLFEQSSVKINN